MNEKTLIKYPSISASKLNANMLIKYMQEYKFLEEILKNKAISPRFSEENISFLNIYMNGKKINKIYIPMICFCDIGFTKVNPHIKTYGSFGVALTKEWGLKNKILPIHYLIDGSELCDELKKIIRLANQTNNLDLYKFIFNYCFYSKEIEGYDTRSEQRKLFSDEQEWRYVPQINIEDSDIKQFYLENIDYNLAHLSDSLKYIENIHLKFEEKDIKYIVLPSREYQTEITSLIFQSDFSIDEKNSLITKIKFLNESDDY